MTKTSSNRPSPLHGFDSWLEYALSTFDVRSVMHDAAWDGKIELQREDIEAAVWSEFNELRRLAGLPQKNRPSRDGMVDS